MAVQLEEQHDSGETPITIKIYFEIPNFYGRSSVRVWVKQCEKCFSLLETPNEQKVDLAYMCMFDKAYVWARDYIGNNLAVEWPEFARDLCDKFGTKIRGDTREREEQEFKEWGDSLEKYFSDRIQDNEDFFNNNMEHMEKGDIDAMVEVMEQKSKGESIRWLEENMNKMMQVIKEESKIDESPKKEKLQMKTDELGTAQACPADYIVKVFTDEDFDFGDKGEGVVDALGGLIVDSGCISDAIEVPGTVIPPEPPDRTIKLYTEGFGIYKSDGWKTILVDNNPDTLKKLNDAEEAKKKLEQHEYFDPKIANKESELAEKYEVQGLPATYFFVDGVHKPDSGQRTKDGKVSDSGLKIGPGVSIIEDGYDGGRYLWNCSEYNFQFQNDWKVKPLPWRDKIEIVLEVDASFKIFSHPLLSYALQLVELVPTHAEKIVVELEASTKTGICVAYGYASVADNGETAVVVSMLEEKQKTKKQMQTPMSSLEMCLQVSDSAADAEGKSATVVIEKTEDEAEKFFSSFNVPEDVNKHASFTSSFVSYQKLETPSNNKLSVEPNSVAEEVKLSLLQGFSVVLSTNSLLSNSETGVGAEEMSAQSNGFETCARKLLDQRDSKVALESVNDKSAEDQADVGDSLEEICPLQADEITGDKKKNVNGSCGTKRKNRDWRHAEGETKAKVGGQTVAKKVITEGNIPKGHLRDQAGERVSENTLKSSGLTAAIKDKKVGAKSEKIRVTTSIMDIVHETEQLSPGNLPVFDFHTSHSAVKIFDPGGSQIFSVLLITLQRNFQILVIGYVQTWGQV